jgi:hypothetical protein
MVLSPAAQAVLDAWSEGEGGVYLEGDPDRLAAALRAAADQVVPEREAPEIENELGMVFKLFRSRFRSDFLAIAAELDNPPITPLEENFE